MGSLRIVSDEATAFEDREEAGFLVGEALTHLRNLDPLVLGIPRGGLVVAQGAAKVLGAELDAIFALKLRFPGNLEVAVGAVAEGGLILVNEPFVAKMGIGDALEEEKERRLGELARRAGLIRKHRRRVPLAGRTVIVTDDGVATGSTTRAAFRAVRQERPRRLIGAFPVGDRGAIEKLAGEVDEMVCLRCPPSFRAVSQFYRTFPQVETEEVVRIFSP
jgi:predicted phosphoribosyltransferase